MKRFDIKDRVRELWDYYDEMLEDRIARIAERSEVDRSHFIKINPAEFIEKNPMQIIEGYKYQKIRNFIIENKTDDTFLISPLDAIEETAEQVSYKRATHIKRKIRASKCGIVPVPKELAQDFLIRNHRQTAPNMNDSALSLGLQYGSELVAVMIYARQGGAVRGSNNNYELLRLSISKDTQIHGAASKLQKACEQALRDKGEETIFSYSNATINSGKVYKALGFTEKRIDGGQPHVIMRNNALVRLVKLYPKTTNGELAIRGWIKTFLGGNKMWTKRIDGN